jgi:7-cyano-7-deazaguanine synthase in queuosine biosynthesis
MGMTDFCLRTRRDQEIAPAPTVLLDWFQGGDGTIQVRQSLTSHLAPPTVAMDILRLAAAVYCADRLTLRPGTWTRSIRLELPVRDVVAWSAVADDLASSLSFLSGDHWTLRPIPNTEPGRHAQAADDPVDTVCLFSGGLDSFAGAVDLLADGKRVCLVAHYEGGQAPKTQEQLARRLARRFGTDRVVLRRIFLRPAPKASSQIRPLPEAREPSTRSRSLLFLAAGLVVAAGYGPDVPLVIPENGFIGINVPLTDARNGSLTTRTTHPHFMAELSDRIVRLGITNTITNPFRLMTKGEMLAASKDRETLFALARNTLSCAHPEAPRFAKRRQGNCGYCFPCLIRRGALNHVGLDDPADYSFDAMREDDQLTGGRGDDLRALVRSLNRTARPVDVLRNGPVPSAEVRGFAGAYERGRTEIVAWMHTANPSANLRRLLPP